MPFQIINVLNLLQDCPEIAVDNILHAFSCPKNKSIEHFLHVNAISCARQRFAITYLILNECDEMAGFFTLTHKPVFF